MPALNRRRRNGVIVSTVRIVSGCCSASVRGWLSGSMQLPVVVGTDAEPALNVSVLNWISAQTGEPLNLFEPDIAPGKRIRSQFISEGQYRLVYPDYRQGYAAMLNS